LETMTQALLANPAAVVVEADPPEMAVEDPWLLVGNEELASKHAATLPTVGSPEMPYTVIVKATEADIVTVRTTDPEPLNPPVQV
jgi:hypothetical protein